MKIKYYKYCLCAVLSFWLVACHRAPPSESLTMIQITDRHHMHETISQKEKLEKYQTVNFMEPQPYEKVVRVYGKDLEGKQRGVITSYHDNGLLKEFLESFSSRAFGCYKEWYSNGQLKIEAVVIEGIADLSPHAKETWLFDGLSKAYADDGSLKAEFHYVKGQLEGQTLYYYPSGEIEKIFPYKANELWGELVHYNKEGDVIGFSFYENGVQHGNAIFYGNKEMPYFEEVYDHGKLMEGRYFNFKRELISTIKGGFGMQSIYEGGALVRKIEYQEGLPGGKVESFSPAGWLENVYTMQKGKKQGEELVYYPSSKGALKLYISWYDDEIHGIVKTWYESGKLESQREMAHNQRQGMAVAWYENGERMFVEEYENDKLVSGQYYKRGMPQSISFIDKGNGVASLYDKDGIFLNKVFYKNGEIIQK